MSIIYGKKVVLFQANQDDLKVFVRLHREDPDSVLGDLSLKQLSEVEATQYVNHLIINKQLLIWTGMTKQGKGSRLIGFIYLTDFNDNVTQINGVMDQTFIKGLLKEFRRNKYTYSEDALRTMIGFLFDDMKVKRIETYILKTNRLPQRLCERVGFIKEGELRNASHNNGQAINVIVSGLLKGEYTNGQTSKSKTATAGPVATTSVRPATGTIRPATGSVDRGSKPTDAGIPAKDGRRTDKNVNATPHPRTIRKRTRRSSNRKRKNAK